MLEKVCKEKSISIHNIGKFIEDYNKNNNGSIIDIKKMITYDDYKLNEKDKISRGKAKSFDKKIDFFNCFPP